MIFLKKVIFIKKKNIIFKRKLKYFLKNIKRNILFFNTLKIKKYFSFIDRFGIFLKKKKLSKKKSKLVYFLKKKLFS